MDTTAINTLRLVVSGQSANQMLREDVVNAVRRLWQFAKGLSEKQEYAIVYNKLVKQPDDALFKKVWDNYNLELAPWLAIPVLDPGYLRNVDDLDGSGTFKSNQSKLILHQPDSDENTAAQVAYWAIDRVSKKPIFYLRDLGARAIDSYYYMGKLWRVTRSNSQGKQQFVLDEVP